MGLSGWKSPTFRKGILSACPRRGSASVSRTMPTMCVIVAAETMLLLDLLEVIARRGGCSWFPPERRMRHKDWEMPSGIKQAVQWLESSRWIQVANMSETLKRWSRRRKSRSVLDGRADFQQPFTLPESAQTLAGIAFHAAGQSGKTLQQRRNLPENPSSKKCPTATAFSVFLSLGNRARFIDFKHRNLPIINANSLSLSIECNCQSELPTTDADISRQTNQFCTE